MAVDGSSKYKHGNRIVYCCIMCNNAIVNAIVNRC